MSDANQVLGADSIAGLPAPPDERRLLAPVWHTVIIIALMLGNSFLTASLMAKAVHSSHSITHEERLLQYGVTICLELVLLLLVWLGLRKNIGLRELIGGRWETPEAFLIEIAIAVGFWIAAALILAGLGYLLGLADASQVTDIKRRIGGLIPQTALESVLWVMLSCTAGFVEEIIFRGYLQRQIGAMAGNIYVGLIASAIIFGAGHGYEGARRMLLIAVFGAMFGILALLRKSLRPGMMAHAFHDSFAGLAFRFLPK